jgi:hypothetical protein
VRGQPGSAQQRSFCGKTFPFSKNHDRGPWIFTYEPLNFRENMFVVHAFTYEPLNLQENMFAVHDCTYEPLSFRKICLQSMLSQKKDLEFRNNPPENVYNFFTYEPLNFWKKIVAHNFQKKPQTSIQPTRRP